VAPESGCFGPAGTARAWPRCQGRRGRKGGDGGVVIVASVLTYLLAGVGAFALVGATLWVNREDLKGPSR